VYLLQRDHEHSQHQHTHEDEAPFFVRGQMLVIPFARVRWVIRPRVIVNHKATNKDATHHHNAHRHALKDHVKTLLAAEGRPRDIPPP
jgi:hypothetical protein